MVMKNKFWLTDVGTTETDITKNVQQNVQRLTHRKKGYKQLFTLDERSILNKPADDRTEEELQHISKIIASLNCFSRYPDEVKYKLAGVCYFCYYPPGRMIVKQNHQSECMYFILSGIVAVIKTCYDELDERYYDAQVALLEEGSLFGEVALLHDIPRQASIVTTTDCEFLKMSKDDFNNVMKATIRKKWDEVEDGMKKINYFDTWNSIQVRECCIISRMKEFEPGNIILSNDNYDCGNYAYFILSGQVRIIEELFVYEWTNKRGEKQFVLNEKAKKVYDIEKESSLQDSQERLARRRRLESLFEKKCAKQLSMYPNYKRDMFKKKSQPPPNAISKSHFVQVCLLNKLGCFGLGELSLNRMVVASKHTKCLLIPQYFLFTNNSLDQWNKVKYFLINRIPNTDVVFKEFILAQEWKKYKESLMKSLINKPPVNSLSNVPYSIRLRNYYET